MTKTLKQEIRSAATAGFRFYVYTLADESGVFYVGKGTADRVFHHGKDASNRWKQARIASAGGGEHIQRAVLAYFVGADDAIEFESCLIQEGADSLTNIMGGARGFGRSREELQAIYRGILKGIPPFERTALASPRPWLGFPTIDDGRRFYDNVVAAIRREVLDPSPTEVERLPDGSISLAW